jgi:hypothetical protein
MRKAKKKSILAKAVDVFGDPLEEIVSAESLQVPAAELEETSVSTTDLQPFSEALKVAPEAKKKPVEAEEEDDSRIRVGNDVIDARLSRKQKIALLVKSITSGDLAPIDLIRAMQMHTDLSGDDGSGQIYELKVVLDA